VRILLVDLESDLARRAIPGAPPAPRPRWRAATPSHLLAAEKGAALAAALRQSDNIRRERHRTAQPCAAPAPRAGHPPLCSANNGFDVVHANEAHALTAAWLAGAHRRATVW
jgi:hypothetical protein